MVTIICMLTVLAFLAVLVLWQDSKCKVSEFFSIDATNCMRGFWSIIILLVHIPAAYQNPLQDAIGSFAYIGVSFFFMTSGYGLFLSVLKNSKIRGKAFWGRRLPKLLLPMILSNILLVIVNLIVDETVEWWQFISITGFVRQLLLFYLIFFMVFRFLPHRISVPAKANTVCICIVLFSLIIYLFNPTVFTWPVESLGFAYGILLARYKDKFEKFAVSKWFIKVSIFGILALLLGFTYIKFKHIIFIGDYITKILLGIALLAFLLIFSIRRTPSNTASRFLGSISYEIYLIHGTVFALISGICGVMDSGVFILISIALTVLLSFIINVICKKTLRAFDSIARRVK